MMGSVQPGIWMGILGGSRTVSYTHLESVMFDGSVNDLDKNIELTKQVVLKAHELGVCVEGEIGHVGSAADADNHKEDLYTKEMCIRDSS